MPNAAPSIDPLLVLEEEIRLSETRREQEDRSPEPRSTKRARHSANCPGQTQED